MDFQDHINSNRQLNQNHDYNKLVKLFHSEANTEYARMKNARQYKDVEKEKRREFKAKKRQARAAYKKMNKNLQGGNVLDDKGEVLLHVPSEHRYKG